jgi:hypothetical protein
MAKRSMHLAMQPKKRPALSKRPFNSRWKLLRAMHVFLSAAQPTACAAHSESNEFSPGVIVSAGNVVSLGRQINSLGANKFTSLPQIPKHINPTRQPNPIPLREAPKVQAVGVAVGADGCIGPALIGARALGVDGAHRITWHRHFENAFSSAFATSFSSSFVSSCFW